MRNSNAAGRGTGLFRLNRIYEKRLMYALYKFFHQVRNTLVGVIISLRIFSLSDFIQITRICKKIAIPIFHS